jgi:hypothetical protein
LTSALEGVGWSVPRPGRFTPGKDPVPIVQEAGLAPGLFWTCAKNLAPTGVFFFYNASFCSYLVLCCSGIELGAACCGFFQQEKSDGFFYIYIYICSYLVLHCSGIGLSMVICIALYRMLWISPAGKIRRLRSGANPRTWVPKASMLTTRPPKPLIHSLDRPALSQSLYRLSYSGQLYDRHYSQNIIPVVKSRRIRWAGLVTRMGNSRGAYEVLVGQTEGKHRTWNTQA